MRRGVRAVAVIAAAAMATGLGIVGAGAAYADGRVTFAGSVPSWATTANDQGAADPAETEEAEIYLPLRNAQGAQQLAAAVSQPGGSGYRRARSPQQWIAQYSPTPATYAKLLAYLKRTGVSITATPDSRLYVVFRGTADQLGTIFGTSIHAYDYDGQRLLAPSSAPSVPSDVADAVSGIGLDQAKLLTRPDSMPQDGPSPAGGAAQRFAAPQAAIDTPCSAYAGQNSVTVPPAYGTTSYPTALCGYTPAQLRSAYGTAPLLSKGITGAGQTVAIIDAYDSPSIVQDVNTWAANRGEPALARGQYTDATPKLPFSDQEACAEPSGWQTEQTLDVEAVHGIAPAAGILYVGGYNCGGGIDVALSKILDNKLANIVSNSYGDGGEALPADVLAGENNLYLQAAGEGIGLYFSSGDDGDNADLNDGAIQASFPASDPWVTAVGGTSIGIDQKGAIAWETGWGDTRDQIVKDATTGALSYTEDLPGTDFHGGAGGGISTVFPEPSYQKGIVPDSLAKGKRTTPDISALADPYTGYTIGYRALDDANPTVPGTDYAEVTYGGTSLASPLVAAQVALVQQQTRTTIGFANPTLYAIAKVLPSAYRDVLPSNPPQALAFTSPTTGLSFLITMDRDSTLTTQRRYDDVTGIGEVSFTLLGYLAQGRH